MKIKLLIVVVLLSIFSGCNTTEKKDDVLRVGMDLQYPPFETVDESGEPTGISVEIAEELGRYLGREVEIVNTSFDTLITALETEDIDVIIGSMSITEERGEKIDFSDPYNYFKIIGLANNDYLKDNGYDEDTTFEEIFSNDKTRFVGITSQVSATIPEEKGFDVLEVPEKSSAVIEVVQGESDILLMSTEVVVGAHKANLNTTTVLFDSAQNSPIGMGVKKGNSELLDDINKFIAQMESSGFNDKIREEYNSTLQDSSSVDYDYYLE